MFHIIHRLTPRKCLWDKNRFWGLGGKSFGFGRPSQSSVDARTTGTVLFTRSTSSSHRGEVGVYDIRVPYLGRGSGLTVEGFGVEGWRVEGFVESRP